MTLKRGTKLFKPAFMYTQCTVTGLVLSLRQLLIPENTARDKAEFLISGCLIRVKDSIVVALSHYNLERMLK